MTSRVFCIAAAIISFSLPAVSQEIDFLPKGVISSKYEFKNESENGILNGSKKDSFTAQYLDRSSISETAVNGDINYRTSYHLFKLKYGLADTVNLELVLPYLDRKRESNLTVVDTSNAAHTQFADRYDNAQTQGLGDMSLYYRWRPVYTDTVDFRLNFELNGNNGAVNISDGDKVSIGNGAYDFGFNLKFLIYSSSSTLTGDIELGTMTTFDANIEQNGESYKLEKGYDVYLSMQLEDTLEAWNYGGGLKLISVGKSSINGEDQKDNYLAATYKLYLNYGNLYLLEQSKIDLPWIMGFYIENTFFGANAPAKDIIGLQAVFYF